MSIFLDFDGTITVKDTIGEVAKCALRVQCANNPDGDFKLQQDWNAVVKAYVDDYRDYVESYHPPEGLRDRLEHELTFMRGMKDVELRSLQRINACGVFKGISPDQFRQGGRDAVRDGAVRIRSGFARFVQNRVREGWRIWVISVNWSTAFIEGVLDCEDVCVLANHVREDGSIVGPHVLTTADQATDDVPTLTNSGDKLEVMKAALEQDGELNGKPSFYFGDSITDLECLLAATCGVVVSDDDGSKLLETLRRIGKNTPRAVSSNFGQRIMWVSDYEEITRDIKFDL